MQLSWKIGAVRFIYSIAEKGGGVFQLLQDWFQLIFPSLSQLVSSDMWLMNVLDWFHVVPCCVCGFV